MMMMMSLGTDPRSRIRSALWWNWASRAGPLYAMATCYFEGEPVPGHLSGSVRGQKSLWLVQVVKHGWRREKWAAEPHGINLTYRILFPRGSERVVLPAVESPSTFLLFYFLMFWVSPSTPISEACRERGGCKSRYY
jgi:hypothetical protein